MSQQLIKKNQAGGYSNVMPKSWIEAIKDKGTGQTLVEILQGFNMYFLPYNGNTSQTRCLVPTILRKKGLWITYVKYDGNVYTEWYAADEIDDKSWGDSSNWRIGNNTLVGDITISANGNWVINGTETEFKAIGEKGNTPLIRVDNNRLQVSYDLGDTYMNVTENPVYTQFRNHNNKIQFSTDLGATWTDASDEIAAYFRWYATTGDTQANNVGRLQISRDNKTWTNLSNDIINNLHISRYIGVNESLPTSNIAEGTIYAKGPYYAEDDALNENPIYRLWVYAWKDNTLAWQDNGEFTSIAAGVVQETGNSETEVMSQKATTEKLEELSSKSVYFKPSSEKQFTDRIKELYLEGLDVSKKYYAKYLQRLISGTYVADQISIYEYTADDKSDEIFVAVCEDTTLSEDIVPIKERNDSGISGYWIKHFNETDRIVGVVPSTSDIIVDTVSNVRYSPTICGYLESKRIRELINGKGYFVESLEPSRVNHVTELYLEGLDISKRYYARINQYHTTDYVANQLFIYEYTLEDRSDAIRVAKKEERDLNKKTLQISADGDSNITGYALINNFDNMSVSNSTTPDINIAFVSNIDNSPILREILMAKNVYLKQHVDKKICSKLKELYLQNLNTNKIYRFALFRRLESGSYIADQIHIYQYDNENLDNPIKVAVCEDTTFSKGVVTIKESNNSGISGYIIKDIDDDDKLLDLSYYDIDINAVGNLYNSQTILNEAFINPYRITERVNYGYWVTYAELLRDYNKDIYVTYEGAITETDSYLSKVTFGTNSNTTTKFAIGYIDQRNIPIIRTTFSVPCVPWKNTVSLIDRKIKIKAGEQLFVVVGKKENSIYFKRWTEENELQQKYQMLYGSISNGVSRLASEFGAAVSFTWETIGIDTIFADKQELQSVDNKATEANDLAQSALSKIGYFTDRQNNIYKAIVVNGTLQLVPSIYKKILLFCNSTGKNGRVYSKGWGGYRGMASSKNGLDYYTHISNGFKQKDSNAQVVLKNVWEWEHDFSVGYEQYFTNVSNIDCIIFRAGENVKDISAFKENLLSLIDYCINQFPTAEILITTTTSGHQEKDSILLDVATLRNCLFVKTTLLGKEHHEKIGHYLYGDYTPDNGASWDTTTQVFYKISDSGVANHANDTGMLYMANKILQTLKYQPINLLHNITIGETNGYTCDIVNTQWVENGVVNVISNGNNVSVLTTDDTSVDVINHNDGVFTFDMPNQDVIISVS